MRDYYEILGVERSADEAALKSSFRKLAMEHHPDRNGGCEEAAGRFKEINEAYSVLSDPQKRAAYDRFGHAGVNGAAGGGGGAQFHDVNDIFNEVFGDVFGDMFGGRGRQRSGPARGQDLRYDLEITLEQAYAGSEVEITVPASINCETCDGSGARPGTSPTVCGGCGGAGRVRASQGFFSIERACPRCGGSGRLVLDPCEDCHGHGQVRKQRTLQVRIPAGVDDGARIRLAGEGDAGARGGPRGDLYIFLSVKPHEFYQRDGADLSCAVPISMTTAALGGTFDVATLDGTKSRVSVPEGTQAGRQFRLKGKGMPVLRSTQIGDLYIQIQIETPQKLTKRQRELLKEFEEISSKDNNPESAGFFARMKEFFEG